MMPVIGRRMVPMVLTLGLLISSCATTAPPPAAAQRGPAHVGGPRIITDSSLSLWWDDATAIGMANVLAQLGQLQLLGITSDIQNPLAVAAMDAIDTSYGHPNIA